MSTQLAKRDEQLPAQQPRGQDIYGAVLAAVKDHDTDPERLEKFLAVAERMEDRHAKRLFFEAFHAAKAEMDGLTITKRGKIIYPAKAGKLGGTVKYAKYDDIAKVIKPILNRHGLTESFTYEYTENPPKIICVMKLTGMNHTEEFRSVPMPMIDSGGGKNDVQGAGSVASYGKRFVIVPAFDIITEDEDDDGSGQGVAEPITDEQAQTIEACLDNLGDASKKRFYAWLEKAHKTRDIRQLTQGPQFDGVMELLKKKLAVRK